uniref:Uncharacterized protein n=1 Tax=Cyclotella atomus TaxID=382360 RepID=A0ABD3MUY7_9STRA
MGCWQERKGKRKKEREARKMVDKVRRAPQQTPTRSSVLTEACPPKFPMVPSEAISQSSFRCRQASQEFW